MSGRWGLNFFLFFSYFFFKELYGEKANKQGCPLWPSTEPILLVSVVVISDIHASSSLSGQKMENNIRMYLLLGLILSVLFSQMTEINESKTSQWLGFFFQQLCSEQVPPVAFESVNGKRATLDSRLIEALEDETLAVKLSMEEWNWKP